MRSFLKRLYSRQRNKSQGKFKTLKLSVILAKSPLRESKVTRITLPKTHWYHLKIISMSTLSTATHISEVQY